MQIRERLAVFVALAAAAVLAVGLTGVVPANATVSTQLLPYRIDGSNQAGWWTPMDEYDGRVYLAYNAWGSASAGGATDTHTVYVASRAVSGGAWSRGCLRNAAGSCAVYSDNGGHNQPSITVDGDGYIHAFVSMHAVNWRYYRSARPGDVTSMVNRSSELPDQAGRYTYPAVTRTENGDAYLIIRAEGAGRLYRWDNAGNTWSRIATFAEQDGFIVYPDDIAADSSGNLHIVWEWASGGTNGLRHLGSYLRYSPATNEFHNAAGVAVTVPATQSSPVVFQPLEGLEQETDRHDAANPGVQSAKVTADAAGRPFVAYRYRSELAGPFRVRLATWADDGWQRSVVYQGTYDTYAAVDVTVNDSRPRVYYVKKQTSNGDQAFAATGQDAEPWAETLLLPRARVERLSVVPRGTVDHLYLVLPGSHDLYYGKNTW